MTPASAFVTTRQDGYVSMHRMAPAITSGRYELDRITFGGRAAHGLWLENTVPRPPHLLSAEEQVRGRAIAAVVIEPKARVIDSCAERGYGEWAEAALLAGVAPRDVLAAAVEGGLVGEWPVGRWAS
jgi:hypothetical protein